jgi:hypothetical protein
MLPLLPVLLTEEPELRFTCGVEALASDDEADDCGAPVRVLAAGEDAGVAALEPAAALSVDDTLSSFNEGASFFTLLTLLRPLSWAYKPTARPTRSSVTINLRFFIFLMFKLISIY